MAEQKILISIQINDRETANTNKALKVTKKNFDSLTKAEKEAIIADKQLALSAKQLDKELTAKAAAANAAADATGKMGATSGLNNAILMETSRLASDASYGFTAIANNLSQLVNLMQSQIQATGSLGKSLKGLISAQSLFLIGVQLAITYGDRLAKAFMNASDASFELNNTFKNLGKEVSSSAGNFETYISIIQDTNRSQEQQNIAVKKLNKEFPDYIKQLDEAGVSLDDVAKKTKKATEENDKYRDSLIELAMSRAAQNKIEELAAERLDLIEERRKGLRSQGILDEEAAQKEIQRIDEEYGEEFIEYNERYNEIVRTTDKETQQALLRQLEQSNIGRLLSRRNYLSAQKELNKEEIKDIEEQIKVYSGYVKLQNKTDEDGNKDRNRIFKEADLDFEKETQQSRERVQKSLEIDEEAQIKIKFDGIKERARIKQKEFEDDQKRRLKDYLERIKDDDNFAEKKKVAEDKLNKEIANSKESLSIYEKQLNVETLDAIYSLRAEQAEKIVDIERENRYKREETLQREADQEILNEGIKARNLFDLRGEQLEKEQERLQFRLDNEKLSFNERLNLEKQLTDVEQEQSDRRIQIAELEAQAKRQTLEVSANALLAFSNLVGKETGAGKALAVAGTLISTYLSAQKAYESQFAPLALVDSPVRGAIAAAAAVAAGLANVKAILSVKTPNDKSQGAAAARRTIQAPSFNVVGASQTSQLAQTVATQEAKPVKAFVVGKDISTQQELDRNITNTASFG